MDQNQMTEKVKKTLDRTFKKLVAERAYQKWEARGRQEGGELQDWLEAEKEVAQQLKGGKKLPVPNNIKALNGHGRSAICPQPHVADASIEIE